MSGFSFHETRMGHRFYESTMPELVRQLTRLNDLLERLASPAEPKSSAMDVATADCDGNPKNDKE